MAKASLKALPLDIRKTLGLISGIAEEGDKPLYLDILVDETLSKAMREACRQAFHPAGINLTVSLQTYAGQADRTLAQKLLPEPDLPGTAEQADLVVILANRSPWTAELFFKTRRSHPVVIVAEDIMAFVAAWPDTVDIDTACLIALTNDQVRQSFDALFANLAAWILETQVDLSLSWARGLKFIRQLHAAEIVNSTALQNGVIATIDLLPGKDMPVLLLNQTRMFFRLAAISGIEFTGQPYNELAALIVQGFAWRGLARRLSVSLPAISWAIKGTVGYLGTLALGKLALHYLDFKLREAR